MVFLGVYRAIYDYAPQSSNEIALEEGDILMVLEKSTEDDWWKAKKKGGEDDDEEPEGLIPNYIEEVGCYPPWPIDVSAFYPASQHLAQPTLSTYTSSH